MAAALLSCSPAAGAPFTLGQVARGGSCADATSCTRSEPGATAVAISPDGVYVYSVELGQRAGTGGIEEFRRTPATGALTEVECVRETGETGCEAPIHDSEHVQEGNLSLSPDGAFLYVVGSNPDRADPGTTITAFRRDAATGRLTRAGCVNESGTTSGCSAARLIRGARRLAVSPDGHNVYVLTNSGYADQADTGAGAEGAIGVLAVDPVTGALTQVGCVSEDGSDGSCVDGGGLTEGQDITVSADGSKVFVAAARGGLYWLDRNPSDGSLTPAGCMSARGLGPAVDGPRGICARGLRDALTLAVAPATGQLLVGSSSGLLLFATPPPSRRVCLVRCHAGKNTSVDSLAVTPDGGRAFAEVAGERESDLRSLARSQGSGRLEPVGCIGSEYDVARSGCSIGRYSRGGSLVTSPDGTSVYLAGDYGQGVAAFGPAVGATATRDPGARRVSVLLTCPGERTIGCVGMVRVRVVRRIRRGRLPDPRPRPHEPASAPRSYSLRGGESAHVLVRLSDHGRRASQLAVAASDETGITMPTYAPVVTRR